MYKLRHWRGIYKIKIGEEYAIKLRERNGKVKILGRNRQVRILERNLQLKIIERNRQV